MAKSRGGNTGSNRNPTHKHEQSILNVLAFILVTRSLPVTHKPATFEHDKEQHRQQQHTKSTIIPLPKSDCKKLTAVILAGSIYNLFNKKN